MQGALIRTAAALVITGLGAPAAASQQGRSHFREPAPVIVEVRNGGFGWGALGIGVVGGVGIGFIAAAVSSRAGVPSRAPSEDRSRATGALPKGDAR